MEIKNVDNIVVKHLNSSTPARYYYKHKTIVINPKPFSKLNRDQKLFVLFHELGHAELQTRNEIEADNYAFNLYAQRGNSLKNSFFSLSKTLNHNNPANVDRIRAGFIRAAKFDQINNNNQKIKQMNIPFQYNEFAENAALNWVGNEMPITIEGDGSDFLGFGKKAKERREQRQEQRAERKAAKTEIKKAKAESIRNGSFQSVGSKIVETAGNIGKKFLGIEDNPMDVPNKEVTTVEQQPQTNKKNNTVMIIIIIIIIVAIIAGILYFKNKPK